MFVEMVDHRAGERPVQLVGEHEEATPAPASLRQVVGRAERRRGHRGVDDHDVGPAAAHLLEECREPHVASDDAEVAVAQRPGERLGHQERGDPERHRWERTDSCRSLPPPDRAR